MAPIGEQLRERVNLRDLGGAPAAGGTMRVRLGQVYRAAMPDMDDAALSEALRTLGLRAVLDLRAGEERGNVPAAWQALGCEDYITHDGESSAGNLGRMWREATETDSAAVRQAMITLYRHLPATHSEAYKRLFERLADGRTPLLFHCTAGKDRTGVAAALLLEALEVPREAIFEDYLRTNEFDKRHIRWGRRGELMRGVANGEEADERRRATMAPILAADAAYLEGAFAGIESEYGSVPAYLDRALGIDADRLDRIRAHLLEPAG